MIRSFFFWIVVIIDTFVMGMAFFLLGLYRPYTRISQLVYVWWSRTLLWSAGIRVRVHGRDNLRPDASYIIVSNHQSHLDIPLLMGYLPLHLTIVAKKELFKIPVFGWAMKAGGILKIDRSHHKKAVETLQRAEETLLNQKLSVLMFPEGTRSESGKLQSFKKGPFVLALNTQLPILPVSVSGSHSLLPKGTFYVKPGKTEIFIHPPVETTGLTLENRNELVQKVRTQIEAKLDEGRAPISKPENIPASSDKG